MLLAPMENQEDLNVVKLHFKEKDNSLCLMYQNSSTMKTKPNRHQTSVIDLEPFDEVQLFGNQTESNTQKL